MGWLGGGLALGRDAATVVGAELTVTMVMVTAAGLMVLVVGGGSRRP